MRVELRYFDDCPNWRTADRHLRALASELDLDLTHRLVETPEDAEALGFRGSPSIVIDDVDLFAVGPQPVGLSCRIYETPDGPAGSPTVEQLRAALADPSRGENP